MKRKEILRTLHKIKWDGKVSKMPQLGKLLKNALVSPRIDPNVVLDYLLVENAVFKYIHMCHDTNDDFLLENCDLEVIRKLVESFQPITSVSHPFVHEVLGLDLACLDLILSYMGRNYADVVDRFFKLDQEYTVTKLTFDKCATHTMKLVAEVIIYCTAACLRLGREMPDNLTQFSMNTFMELCEKFNEAANNTKRRILTHSIPRMHVYLVVALRLYVALVSRMNNFTINITVCMSLYELLTTVASTVDVRLDNFYYERYVYVPLTILSTQIMVFCWSSACTLQIQENDSTQKVERRRSKTLGGDNEKHDLHQAQQINIIHTADCARYVVNYLGKLFLNCSDFRLRTIETSINQFVSLLMLIYISHIPSTYLAEVSFDGMKCGYKNRYIHFCFGASALAAKKYIISRSALESFMEFSSWVEFNDSLQVSSTLLLLSTYINNTGQIDKAMDVIEKQILPNKQNLPAYSLAIVYLAYSICFLYKSRYVVLCDDNRSGFLRQALKHINRAYELDDGDGEIVFYRAYTYAKLGQIDEAFDDAKTALQLLPDDPRPYQLKVLLCCCEKQYHKAFQLVNTACARFPTNTNLLYLKIKLFKYNNQATTLQHIFLEFNELIRHLDRHLSRCKKETQSAFFPNDHSQPNSVLPKTHSGVPADLPNNNISASFGKIKLDSTLKKFNNHTLAPFIGSTNGRIKCEYFKDYRCRMDVCAVESVQDIRFNLYFAIWESAYELESTMGPELFGKIVVMFPNRPETIYMQELIRFVRHDEEVFLPSEQFLQYLVLYPKHPKLLYLYLKILEKQLDHLSRSGGHSTEVYSLKKADLLNSLEYYAKIVVEVDELNYRSWKILGETLYKLERFDEATSALSTAVEIENIQPVLSFDTIPLLFCPSDY